MLLGWGMLAISVRVIVLIDEQSDLVHNIGIATYKVV